MKGLGGSDQGGDVSAALARLNFGVEDLNRQLKQEVRAWSQPGCFVHSELTLIPCRSPSTTLHYYCKLPAWVDSAQISPKSATSSLK